MCDSVPAAVAVGPDSQSRRPLLHIRVLSLGQPLPRPVLNPWLSNHRPTKKAGQKAQPSLRDSVCNDLSFRHHRYMLIDHFGDRLFASSADYAFDFFAIAEQNQSGNPFDAVALSR